MIKYEYAEQVRDKLIKLLSLNPECEEILKYCNYNAQYRLDRNAVLSGIEFSFYDSITCLDNGAYIKPEYGDSKKILSYNSFDELMNI